MKEWCKKHREILVYLIVGGITTIIAWGVKFGANALLFGNTMYPDAKQATVLSLFNWVSGVSSAYILNRIFVFRSHAKIWPELSKFLVSRISTLCIDWLINAGLALLSVHLVVITVISAVAVTILNYVFSKVFVFKKKAG